MDASYVQEIVRSAPRGMSEQDFERFTAPDVRAGYRAEVKEAKRRYFAGEE